MESTRYVFPKLEWYTPFIRNEILPIVQDRIYDRTGTVDLGWDQHIVSHIPEWDPRCHNMRSFSNLCQSRATDILTLSQLCSLEDKRITILWSGGLDSSAVVVSFLKSSINIDVTMSPSAIEEWPELAKYIRNSPLVNVVEFEFLPFLLINECEGRLWVGGDPGDLLYGGKVDWDGKKHKEFFQPIIDQCPFELLTLADQTWWLGFVLLWQAHCTRIHMIARQYVPNFVNFYDTPQFQQWAMNTKYGWEDKKPTKEHIFSLFDYDTVWKQEKRDSIHGVLKDPLDNSFQKWLEKSYPEAAQRRAESQKKRIRMMELHHVCADAYIDDRWNSNFPRWSELVKRWHEEVTSE